MNNRRIVSIFLFLLSFLCLVGGIYYWVQEREAAGPGEVTTVSSSEKVNEGSTEDKQPGDQESAEAQASSVIKEYSETKEEPGSIGPGTLEESGTGENSETKEEPGSMESLGAKENESSPLLPENPYQSWFLENSDMAAWIQIPDTVVDYPVMWTPEDEEYYLHRGFDKKDYRYGCLILDTDSSMSPLTTNLIIHGHNYSGVMFGELYRYKEKDYREEHPFIFLYSRDCERIYEVMSVFYSQVFYTTDVCFKYYKFFQAETEEEFLDFYENVKKLSFYDTGVEAKFGDHFLTLSTCSDHTKNGRLVVVAKEIETGDEYRAFE